MCNSSLSSAKDRWNFIISVRGSNRHSGNLTAVQHSFGKLIVDNKRIANHFNYVFSSLGYYFGQLLEEAPHSTAGNPCFRFWVVSEKDCFGIFRKLGPNKPTSSCKFPVWEIIDGQQILVPHLTFISNECIKKCTFAAKLKRANITPIYKIGDVLDATNYRPTLITTSFSKILERTLHRQITTYSDNIGTLTPVRCGFRFRVSSQGAIFLLLKHFVMR